VCGICLCVSIRNSIQHALEEENHIPLQSLLISIENSKHNALEEEDHIPLQSLLISFKNSIQIARPHSMTILVDFL
jgi:hypothetical protein